MEPRERQLEQAGPSGCPDCGHDVLVGRFCGRCGKRLVEPEAAAPEIGRGGAPPTSDPDGAALVAAGGSRRRALLLGLVVMTVATVVVTTRPSGEVVTTGPWHRQAGMTSTVAARDLSTELWRADLAVGPEQRPGWRIIGVSPSLVLLSSGDGVTAFDRSSGERRTSLPARVWGNRWGDEPGVGVEDDITVVDGDQLVTVDAATGDVVGRTTLDRPLGLGGRVDALPDGDVLLASTDELRRATATGRTVWSVPVTYDGGTPRTWAVGAALVVRHGDRLEVRDLDSGTRRWQVTGISGGLPPVVDGSDVILVNGGLVTSYDLVSGGERWSTAGGVPLPEDVLGVAGRDLLVKTRAGRGLLRYDLDTGERREATTLELARAMPDPDEGGMRLMGETLLVETATEVRAFSLDRTPRWSAPASSLVPVSDDEVAILDGTTLTVVDVASATEVERVDLRLPPVPGPAAIVGVAGGATSLPGGVIVDLGTGGVLGRITDAEPWVRLIPLEDGFLVEGSGTGDAPSLVDPYGQTHWRAEVGDAGGWMMLHGILDGRLVATAARPLAPAGAPGHEPTGPFVALLDPSTGEQVGEPASSPTRDIFAPGGPWAVGFRQAPWQLVGYQNDGDRLVERWHTEPAGFGWPILRGDALVVQRLASLEHRSVDDGSLRSIAHLPVLPRAAAFGPDTFVVVTGDDRVLGIDAATGRISWERPAASPLGTTITIAGDVVYVGDLEGAVHLLDLDDGAPIRTVHAGAAPVSEVVVAYGVMLAVTAGEVVAFGPDPHRLELPPLPPRELGEVDVPTATATGTRVTAGGSP